MALSNLYDWTKKTSKTSVSSACGTGDKRDKVSSACGAERK